MPPSIEFRGLGKSFNLSLYFLLSLMFVGNLYFGLISEYKCYAQDPQNKLKLFDLNQNIKSQFWVTCLAFIVLLSLIALKRYNTNIINWLNQPITLKKYFPIYAFALSLILLILTVLNCIWSLYGFRWFFGFHNLICSLQCKCFMILIIPINLLNVVFVIFVAFFVIFD